MPPNLEDVIAPYHQGGYEITQMDDDPDSGYFIFDFNSKKITALEFTTYRIEEDNGFSPPKVFRMRMTFTDSDAPNMVRIRDLIPFFGPWRRFPKEGEAAFRGVARFYDSARTCGVNYAFLWMTTDAWDMTSLSDEHHGVELYVSRILEDGEGNTGLSYNRHMNFHCPDFPEEE